MQDIDLTKDILSGKEIRAKLINGANKVANAVKSTLGPMGRNVILELNKYGDSRITKDGVSVAKEIFLEDKYENLGAQLLKKVSLKSAKDAGDGTTTSTVLAQSILTIADTLEIRNVHKFKEGMEAAAHDVVENIKLYYKKDIETIEDIYNVALISSNQDKEIAGLIQECYEKLGINKDVIINLDNSNCYSKSFVDVAQGFQYDKGLPSPYLVNNTRKMELNLEDCNIFLFDFEIPDFDYLIPTITEYFKTTKEPLVIMAQGFGGDSLDGITQNKNKSNLPIYAIECPGYGSRRSLFIQDLAVLTNGTVLSKETGTAPSKPGEYASAVETGKLKSLVSNQFTTTLTFGYGNADKIKEQIEMIQHSIDKNMEFDVEEAERRIANLTSGIAIIHVGGTTELESKEAYDRFEDAVGAVRSALQEGIVPGGGIILHMAQEITESPERPDDKLDPLFDFALGYKTVLNSCKAPIQQIFENAADPTLNTVISNCIQDDGAIKAYDLVNRQFTDNLIDPVKVLRCALENAVSVCGLILSTDVGIVYCKNLDVNSEIQM
jgi:chaperonin GroEL